MAFPYNQVPLLGVTSGIGAAMADGLVENGAKVIAVGQRQERLVAFVKKRGSSKAASIRFCITDRAGLDDFVKRILLTIPPAERHNHMGEEKVRSMGMPVDTFTNETYKQLVSGPEHILVGSVGPETPSLELVKAKQKHSDDLSKFMVSYP
ncbi:short-chain dehydrogenase/oxidoreductase [Colletotrichum fioriniae PJ7]|uniref:Short-chain dehydrogenase/oxidoreductase n=1 Tax=Colletotrichum fioriniae PJ7 TaxID=1445577 RepID=A0A010REI1_9PEZI|nr:short-chain dehydrogenase/oxidoreductase [Colletotrichum fioriniae PJ7]